MKKYLEVAKKNIPAILIVIIVVCIAFAGYQYGVRKEAGKAAKLLEDRAIAAEEKAEDMIEKTLKRDIEIMKENKERDRLIAKTKAENKELEKKRREDAKRMEKLEKKLQVAVPETLLEATREVLDTNEVWWNEERQLFEFSLAAFRELTIKLVDWEDFTLTREPDYKKQILNDAIVIKELEASALAYTETIGNFKIALKESRDSYGQLKLAFDEFKKLPGKASLTAKAFWGLLGFAGGVVFGK